MAPRTSYKKKKNVDSYLIRECFAQMSYTEGNIRAYVKKKAEKEEKRRAIFQQIYSSQPRVHTR